MIDKGRSTQPNSRLRIVEPAFAQRYEPIKHNKPTATPVSLGNGTNEARIGYGEDKTQLDYLAQP
jgi:hypothetical protein